MMITVFVKSTVRPVAVGEAAVVQHLQQDVEHVGVGLLDLVEQDHGVGPAAHRLGQLAALVVAHVARRRADEAGHRVLLHVLRHVEAHHGPLVVEQELGQGPGQLGLAHAGGAQEDEGADGPVAGRRPGPGAPDRVGRPLATASSWPTTRACSRSSRWMSLLHLALQQPGDRDPGPAATTSAMSSSSTSSFSMRSGPGALQVFWAALSAVLQGGQGAVAQLGGSLQVALSLGLLAGCLGLLDLLLDGADGGDGLLLLLPVGDEAAGLGLDLGQFGLQGGETLPAAASLSFFRAARSISS